MLVCLHLVYVSAFELPSRVSSLRLVGDLLWSHILRGTSVWVSKCLLIYHCLSPSSCWLICLHTFIIFSHVIIREWEAASIDQWQFTLAKCSQMKSFSITSWKLIGPIAIAWPTQLSPLRHSHNQRSFGNQTILWINNSNCLSFQIFSWSSFLLPEFFLHYYATFVFTSSHLISPMTPLKVIVSGSIKLIDSQHKKISMRICPCLCVCIWFYSHSGFFLSHLSVHLVLNVCSICSSGALPNSSPPHCSRSCAGFYHIE